MHRYGLMVVAAYHSLTLEFMTLPGPRKKILIGSAVLRSSGLKETQVQKKQRTEIYHRFVWHGYYQL